MKPTLHEENFHWILIFAYSLMANLLNFNSAHYRFLGNLSMMAYVIEIQKPKFSNISFREFDQFEHGP